MSGVRIEQERVSGVWCHSLRDPAFLSMLRKYRKLLLSAYGPKGGSILISNSAGRESLACSSNEIIQQLSFFHPCVKYINALISAQNAACGLHGLYTGILCARLLEEALLCEDDTPHHVILEVTEWIISEVLTCLVDSPEEVVTDLDIGNMHQVTSFVKTILGAKNCLDLTKDDITDLSLNIVKAFLRSIPHEYSSSGFGHVSIVTQDESATSESKVFDGVLYRAPDLCPQKIKKFTEGREEFNIVVFTIPLTFEEGENETVHWRGSLAKDAAFIDVFLPCLLSFLRKRNVSILVSQKPVNPVIIFELERKGYLVLERLGTASTQAIVKISGCQPISSISNLQLEMNNAVLGRLTSVECVSINEKSYLLLDHVEGCVSSLLLCKTSPSTESTLKETAESCLAALRMVVVDGKIVAGGGCLEAWLAMKISHLVNNNLDQLISVIEISPHHVLKVTSMFMKVLLDLAFRPGGGSSSVKTDWCTDSTFHHLWQSHSAASKGENPYFGTDDLSLQPAVCQCVCGLIGKDTVNPFPSNHWQPADFHPSCITRKSLSTSCVASEKQVPTDKTAKGGNSQSRIMSTTINSDSVVDEFGFLSIELDVDSLEEKVDTYEEDVDSLEKTGNSLEEEGDSLEGRLESLEDDADSLEDVLDKGAEPALEKSVNTKAKLKIKDQDTLCDSFPAKYNAIRLALEGFSHLFKIGDCVFDK